MSGADLEALSAGAVEPKVEPKVEQTSEPPSAQTAEPQAAPAEAGQPEVSKQDETMSVTTVPDEAVKQEQADSSADGLQAQPAATGAQLPQVGRGEVILTPAEAKLQKLQKGYSLEPVFVDPAAAAPPVVISGKRERKSSKPFGHSPDNEPDAPARPKAGRPAGVGLPTPKRGGAGGHLPADASISSVPWITEKRKQLEERLAKINKQLKRFSGPVAARGGALPLSSPAPSHAGFYNHAVAETPLSGYGHAPASRSMSVDGDSAQYLGSSNGRVRDRKRQREGGEISAVNLAGAKKPKMKKGQERLAATGKLRNLYLHCEKLVEGLMKEKMSMAYFNLPVDPDKLGIPQYREIIKQPMDLGTVKGKLEGGFYSGVEALEADIYLVFDNAMFFNPPGTDVHECAKALKDISEKRIKRLPKAPAKSGHLSDSPGVGTPNSTGEGTAASQRRMADMMRQMEQMKREIEEVKSKKTTSHKKAADGGKRKSSGGPSNKIMTFEDKRALSLNINKLAPDKLGKVLEIIKKRRSNVVGESEEIEIDIDLLDNTTLRELDKYVKDALNDKPKTSSAASTAAALQSAAQEAVGSVGGGGLGGIKEDSDSDSDSDG